MPIPSLVRLVRIRHRSSFLALNQVTTRWAAPGLVLQVRLWNEDEKKIFPADAVRIGFTASKKVGCSVVRNRARRRLREIVRLYLPHAALPQRDMAFIARAGTLTRTFDQLRQDLLTALARTQAQRK